MQSGDRTGGTVLPEVRSVVFGLQNRGLVGGRRSVSERAVAGTTGELFNQSINGAGGGGDEG